MVLRDLEHFNLIPNADQLSNATLQWLAFPVSVPFP